MRIVGIIGAGQMGSGIAQAVAQNGIKVLLSDVDIALAEKAKAGIDKALTRLVGRDKITPADAEAALARITPIGDYAAMAEADLIIGTSAGATVAAQVTARSAAELVADIENETPPQRRAPASGSAPPRASTASAPASPPALVPVTITQAEMDVGSIELF